MGSSIIAANRYLTLATCGGDGEVWVAPLAYIFDRKDKVFYFYSAKNSKHSQHIVLNAKGAVAIFDSSAPSDVVEGLQFSARVEVVEGKELQDVMSLYFEKSFTDAEERKKWERPIECFLGQAKQRFYRIIPLDLFVNDVDEDMIDYRKGIDLKTL